MWYYIDEKNEENGPCPQLCVRYWINSGFFKPDTKVRHEEFPDFLCLGRNYKSFPDDWLGRAESGELQEKARKEEEAKERAKHVVWVHEPFAARIVEENLNPYIPQSIYDAEDAQRARKNLPLKYDKRSHLFDQNIRIIQDQTFDKMRYQLYDAVKALIQEMKESTGAMLQVEKNRNMIKAMSVKDKKKQKRKEKRQRAKGKSNGDEGKTSERDLDSVVHLDQSVVERLIEMIDPSGFVITNSMHTWGRVCTNEQIVEYLLHKNIDLIQETSNIDIMIHRESMQEQRKKEANQLNFGTKEEKVDGLTSKTITKVKVKKKRRHDNEGGITFSVGGADVLPCLYKYDVLREEAEKFKDDKPKKYKAVHVDEKCWVICAFLKETPVPFDKWVRIIRLQQPNNNDDENSGAMVVVQSNVKDDEASMMQLHWDKWILAGTDEFYHFFRTVAQCPYRDFTEL